MARVRTRQPRCPCTPECPLTMPGCTSCGPRKCNPSLAGVLPDVLTSKPYLGPAGPCLTVDNDCAESTLWGEGEGRANPRWEKWWGNWKQKVGFCVRLVHQVVQGLV